MPPQSARCARTFETCAPTSATCGLNRRFDRMDAKFDGRLGQMDAKLDCMDAKFDGRLGQMDARLDRMDAKFAWLIGFQFATMLAVIGALLNAYLR